MKYTAYYIIRPNKRLRTKLLDSNNLDKDAKFLLMEPVFWTNDQGGRSVWTSKDHENVVKILFIASLKYNYNFFDNELDKLLGDLKFSTETFNKWWDIEVFDGIDENTDLILEDIIKDKHKGILNELEKVNNPLLKTMIEVRSKR